MALRKVISGGQTGVDQAALWVAKSLGLETGGFMPPGFMTEYGPQPRLKQLYGVEEYSKEGYRARTAANIDAADATLVLKVRAFFAPGTGLSISLARASKKPYVVIEFGQVDATQPEEIESDGWSGAPCSPAWNEDVADYLDENHVEVLNVAGPRESKADCLTLWARRILTPIFIHLAAPKRVM